MRKPVIDLDISISILATQAKNGDTAAFSRLYEMIYKDMYYFALSRTGDPNSAADAVSEAVLDSFESISKLKKPESFKSWIFKILARKLSGYSYRKPQPSDIEHQSDTASYSSDFTGIEVLEALGTLSEKERTVMSLSVMCSMTSQEISEITGMNYSTVRSHLFRARKKLIENYAE